MAGAHLGAHYQDSIPDIACNAHLVHALIRAKERLYASQEVSEVATTNKVVDIQSINERRKLETIESLLGYVQEKSKPNINLVKPHYQSGILESIQELYEHPRAFFQPPAWWEKVVAYINQ